ncbi:MAG: LysR family transcriptional regulator [Elusimicrobia bacterium]|nr:LysR family transcriptional regulator [Elusimicrobiota bacterium]
MDLYQLRYFLEVARELSFTRAARNLYVSPPAVSKSVALLEASLKRKLFTRSRRRVELTSEGELLKSKVEKIYDILEGVRLELTGEAREGPSRLKIGSREMITNYLLSPCLAAFRKKYPNTRFGLYELEPRQMAEALRKDLVDFAFYYHGDIADPALEIRKVGAVRSHVYAAKSLLPQGRPPRNLEELLSLPYIAPRYFQSDPTEPSIDGFPDHRALRNIQYEGEFLETHRRYVIDGLAAAVLPDFVIRREWKAGQVLRLEVGPRLGRDIYFIKRKTRPLPRAVEHFLGVLKKTLTLLESPR